MFNSQGRNMRLYCVACRRVVTSPRVPQWSELGRGEPATESVERIHPTLLLETPEQQTNQQIIVPKTVSADQTLLFAAVTFSSLLFFFNLYSCLSVLCVLSGPAPSSQPPSVSSLSSPGSGAGSPLPPVLLTLPPSLFHLAAPSVPCVRLRPHLYVFPDK